MKKNMKGFTLIELLAVIVILALIALITTPIVIGLIGDSHKSTFKNSVEGVYRAIHDDYTQNGYTNTQTYNISSNKIVNTSDTERTDAEFEFQGKLDKGNGTATVTYDDQAGALKIIMKVQNNSFCADNSNKNGRNEYEITKGACS